MKNLKLRVFTLGTLLLSTLVIGSIVSNNQSIYNTVSTDISEEKEIALSEDEVNTNNDTDNKDIYGTFETHGSWVKDPEEPKNLIEMADNHAIVKVKVKSIGNAIFFENTADFSDPNPYTPVEVVIEDILDGTIDNNVNTIYMRGGKVTIADVMKTLDQDSIKKMEFDTLTKEEQETKYISYESDYDYKLADGQEYALVVNKSSNNIYTIIANGYGVFKENSSSKTKSSKRAFINVLTQKELTDEDGKTLLIYF